MISHEWEHFSELDELQSKNNNLIFALSTKSLILVKNIFSHSSPNIYSHIYVLVIQDIFSNGGRFTLTF